MPWKSAKTHEVRFGTRGTLGMVKEIEKRKEKQKKLTNDRGTPRGLEIKRRPR
jgi:hypothetical protein